MRANKGKRSDQPGAWPLSSAAQPARVHRPAGAPRRQRTSRLWFVFRILLAGLLLLAIGAGIAYQRLSATVTSFPGAYFNRGQNAAWLEHTWAGQPHSAAEYDQLAARLRQEQISYVYAHVGPLNSDGTIPDDRAPNAGTLVKELHARMPELHVLAWIGQVEAAAGLPADQSVDLDNPAVRARIAATAAHFVSGLGFDGVHYDIEPIINNNPHFLDLLVATRAVLPPNAILSVVGQKWAPSARIASLLQSKGKGAAWWTSYYYAAVAAHVDQVVAMIYDTGMPTAQLYQLTVQQETMHILEAVRSARQPPQVLIGVPTYPGNSIWFHDSAENMRTGLNGVVAGLNSNRDTSYFAGVAIYRYALTSDADWSIYDTLWLGQR